MYDFEDKGGRRVALRPEITAGLMRAFAEHRPPMPWKVWYAGPELPLREPRRRPLPAALPGRRRGRSGPTTRTSTSRSSPSLDGFHRALGLRQVDAGRSTRSASRPTGPRYVDALPRYFSANAADLSEQSRETLALNPLRVLDSRSGRRTSRWSPPRPRSLEYLTPDAAAHFDRVQEGLKALGIPFEIEPRLVRGLDYYRHTTFEFPGGTLDSAQNAIGGGGRYDGLVEALGGPADAAASASRSASSAPAGLRRRGRVRGARPARSRCSSSTPPAGSEALALTAELRAAGIAADRAFDQPQHEEPDEGRRPLAARTVAVIVGTDELAAGVVTLRALRADEQQGERRQEAVPRTGLVDAVRTWLPS